MRLLSVLYFILITQIAIASDGTDISESQYKVHQLVNDGAWTWFNDERVIVDNQILYIGSIDSQGRVQVVLRSLANPSEELQDGKYIISSWSSKDDHNNPALIKLVDGRILAVYAKHDLEPQIYWRIASVSDSGKKLTWGPETSTKIAAKATYSNLFQLSQENGRIYNFIRAIGYNPNFMYSDDIAGTWEGPFVLIRSGNDHTRPYVKYASNGKDRIDFLYTDGHPRDVRNNNVYHLYYKGGSFYKSDGTLIKTLEQVKEIPLVPSDGTQIYDGLSETGRGWVWDLEYDKNGNPVAAYISSADGARGNDLRYRYARWDSNEKKWIDKQIAFAGTNLYVPENHYAGGITIDPNNTEIVYISTDVIPETGEKNNSGHYQIYQGKLSQEHYMFTWEHLIKSTSTDNIRPIVPRENNCKICLIWLQGQYNSYTDYKMSVVGIIEE
ncbi:MAG: BNR-4 repeat-containing protein [Sedimentisphaerales bacterium]|nr:BNR-4 repeat-containing protein [Sedimentisphaerales bacterium]